MSVVLERKVYERLVFLQSEVGAMADALLVCDSGDVFCRMTCGEAQSIADVFSAAGRDDAAAFILDQHSLSDTDEDDDHHHLNQGRSCGCG